MTSAEPWVPEPYDPQVPPDWCELCGGRRKNFQQVRSELTGQLITVCDDCVAEFGYNDNEGDPE